ncbi:hypothetical protein FKM82_027855 [Ascaphus truei]
MYVTARERPGTRLTTVMHGDGVCCCFSFLIKRASDGRGRGAKEEGEETDRQGQDTETVSSTQLVEARGWLWCALL